jgi:hypothetical protein
MPGHVADNQSIESANHPIRQRLGKKEYTLKDLLMEAIPSLVEKYLMTCHALVQSWQ